MQTTTFEREKELLKEGKTLVIGIDEAGRGPLCGPVVAAAVWYKDPGFAIPENLEKEFSMIRDSKKLSAVQREKIFTLIHEYFYVGIGQVNAETIDRVNILEATFLAMKAALADLRRIIHPVSFIPYLLIDGNQLIPNCSYEQETIIGGDSTVKSIAAASIIAKVTRDRLLDNYDTQFPGYGFLRHKGYGTKEHMDALRKLGPSPIHRMSFRPVMLSLPENVNKRFANVLKPRKT